MTQSKVVHFYNKLDHLIESIGTKDDSLYLERLTNVLRAVYFAKDADHTLNDYKQDIMKIKEEIFSPNYTKQDIHRALQMLLLKGMKDETQPNHRMTPESIALFISYLIQKLAIQQNQLTIFNPASGTGNLLHTVMYQLEQEVDAYASEIDTTLINLSVMVANLLELDIEYFQQDSLRPHLIDPVDFVIADLPVGYYPDETNAAQFQLNPDEGLAYSHHLLIEQSLSYTKPGGYLLFLIPEFLFTSDQAENLHEFLQTHAHIIGIFQLPDTTFKTKDQKKSIFIIRKKGQHTKNVRQPLLVMLPSLKDTLAMENILAKINRWFEEESEQLY